MPITVCGFSEACLGAPYSGYEHGWDNIECALANGKWAVAHACACAFEPYKYLDQGFVLHVGDCMDSTT